MEARVRDSHRDDLPPKVNHIPTNLLLERSIVAWEEDTDNAQSASIFLFWSV